MKIKADNLWLTSDTHYMHKNLVRGVTSWRNSEGQVPVEAVRDFETLEEMNERMVENINYHVSADDWLIHIGDWSFGGFEMVEEFRSKVNCKNVVLILGNHDHHIENNRENVRRVFSHVAHYEELKVNDAHLVLCHYPIISWNGMQKGSFMIHGHQHLKGDARYGEGRRMDVGLCGSPEFRPYHIQEVVDFLSAR